LGFLETSPDLASRFDAAAVGQAHVHDHHVGFGPNGLVDGLAHRVRLGDHGGVIVGVDHGFDPIANDLVIVDQEDADPRVWHSGYRRTGRREGARPVVLRRGGRSALASVTGKVTRRLVPRPLLEIFNVPPSDDARSRMLRSPLPVELRGASKPDPSSSITSTALWPFRTSCTFERFALACRTTLERASRVSCTISCERPERLAASSRSTSTATFAPELA